MTDLGDTYEMGPGSPDHSENLVIESQRIKGGKWEPSRLKGMQGRYRLEPYALRLGEDEDSAIQCERIFSVSDDGSVSVQDVLTSRYKSGGLTLIQKRGVLTIGKGREAQVIEQGDNNQPELDFDLLVPQEHLEMVAA